MNFLVYPCKELGRRENNDGVKRSSISPGIYIDDWEGQEIDINKLLSACVLYTISGQS